MLNPTWPQKSVSGKITEHTKLNLALKPADREFSSVELTIYSRDFRLKVHIFLENFLELHGNPAAIFDTYGGIFTGNRPISRFHTRPESFSLP